MFSRPLASILVALSFLSLPSLALGQTPTTGTDVSVTPAGPDIAPEAAVLGVGVIVAIVIVAIVLNFLPVVIAAMRGHRSTFAIFLLVLFFGWSGIGWLIALIWSFADTGRRD